MISKTALGNGRRPVKVFPKFMKCGDSIANNQISRIQSIVQSRNMNSIRRLQILALSDFLVPVCSRSISQCWEMAKITEATNPHIVKIADDLSSMDALLGTD